LFCRACCLLCHSFALVHSRLFVGLGAPARTTPAFLPPPMSTDASDAKRTDPRFLATVQQEDARLRREYPTPEDIPGCISLLDTFLLCNGARAAPSADAPAR
jgi:hypothetical protein